MRDIEKQIVYKQVLHGRRTIEELTGSEIKELKDGWSDDHFRIMPPVDFEIQLRAEEERRGSI
jgi:hypothetical protein